MQLAVISHWNYSVTRVMLLRRRETFSLRLFRAMRIVGEPHLPQGSSSLSKAGFSANSWLSFLKPTDQCAIPGHVRRVYPVFPNLTLPSHHKNFRAPDLPQLNKSELFPACKTHEMYLWLPIIRIAMKKI